MTIAVWVGVVLLGGAGAVLRFLVDRAVRRRRVARRSRSGTLTVNLTGAVVLGLLSGLALSHQVAAGRDRVDRVLHHVLHLDAGDAAARRGTADMAGGRQHRRQRGARRRRRDGRSVDRGPRSRSTVNDDCLKLTAYFGERQRVDGRFLAEALLDLYGERAVADERDAARRRRATAPRQQLRSDEWLSLSEDPPVAVAAVDTRDKIAGLVDEVVELDAARAGHAGAGPAASPAKWQIPRCTERAREAVKLTVVRRTAGACRRVPAYLAICDLLYREGIAGASVFLGVDGTAPGERQRARFFSRNVDVPMMIISVGNGDRIAEWCRDSARCCVDRCSPSNGSGCANATVSCWRRRHAADDRRAGPSALGRS